MNDQAFWSAMIGDTSAAARQATIKPASMSGSKNANGSGRGWDEALCDTYFCALRLLDAATDASGDKDSAEVAVKSVLQTVEHLRAAAERGEAGSMNQLGIAYAHGRGVQQDRKQAVEWYLKAAEKGNVTAMLNLGWAQLRGHGVARDDKQAVD